MDKQPRFTKQPDCQPILTAPDTTEHLVTRTVDTEAKFNPFEGIYSRFSGRLTSEESSTGDCLYTPRELTIYQRAEGLSR